MRFLACLALSFSLIAAPAFAASEAQMAYVERRGLLETDARCHLLEPNVRSAVEMSLAQARGALLRSGWSNPRIAELDAAAVSAARQRACGDPRSSEAATRAQLGFQAYARAQSMTFQGGERVWIARRYADAGGWRLRQDMIDPHAARFGVRELEGVQRLSLAVPIGRGTPPAAAQLLLRDPSRADTRLLDVPGRSAHGLQAGLPSPQAMRAFWASSRSVDTYPGGGRRVVFTFPDAAFDAMSRLDPRETVEVRLGSDANAQSVLIEVGDLLAARAFLALQPN